MEPIFFFSEKETNYCRIKGRNLHPAVFSGDIYALVKALEKQIWIWIQFGFIPNSLLDHLRNPFSFLFFFFFPKPVALKLSRTLSAVSDFGPASSEIPEEGSPLCQARLHKTLSDS